jgi:hypothetical protein
MAVSEIGSPKGLGEARYLRLDACRFAIGAETKCTFIQSKFHNGLLCALSFWLLAFQSNMQPYETPRVGSLGLY